MAEREGWHAEKCATAKDGGPSVSYRNHNPGNLRSSIFELGKRDGFAFFYNDFTGFFAMTYDIMCKCEGRTQTMLRPHHTLGDLIKIYSACEGNELESYISFVEKRTGYMRDVKLEEFVGKRKRLAELDF